MQANNGRPAKRPAAQNTATGEAQAPKRTERPAAERAQGRRPERNERPDRNERTERTDRSNRDDNRNNRGSDRRGGGRDGRSDRQEGRGGQRFQRGDRPQNGRSDRNQGDRDNRYDNNRGDDRQGRKFGEKSDNRRNDRRNNTSIPAPAIEGQKPQRKNAKGKDDHKKKDYRRDDEERMPKGKKKNEPKQQLQKPQQKEQKVEEEIKTMPNYFSDYDTTVHFISEEELKANHSGIPHGGFVLRSGKTGWDGENKHLIEYSLKLDSNPEFTSSVLIAYARAAYRLASEGQIGCKTVFDIAPAYLSAKSGEELRKHML